MHETIPLLLGSLDGCASAKAWAVIDNVSNLVRRAERRHYQSADWRKSVQQVKASLGLNTEHKA
jgi:hypothetical protein